MKFLFICLVLLLSFETYFLNELKVTSFKRLKSLMTKKIKSLKMSNFFLRDLIQNMGLKRKQVYFIDVKQLSKLEKEDINYEDMESGDVLEFKARAIATLWSRNKENKRHFKPYSVINESLKLSKDNWANYVVMLIDDSGENILARICFPSEIGKDFSLVKDYNGDCLTEIEKVDKIKNIQIIAGDLKTKKSSLIKSNSKKTDTENETDIADIEDVYLNNN